MKHLKKYEYLYGSLAFGIFMFLFVYQLMVSVP